MEYTRTILSPLSTERCRSPRTPLDWMKVRLFNFLRMDYHFGCMFYFHECLPTGDNLNRRTFLNRHNSLVRHVHDPTFGALRKNWSSVQKKNGFRLRNEKLKTRQSWRSKSSCLPAPWKNWSVISLPFHWVLNFQMQELWISWQTIFYFIFNGTTVKDVCVRILDGSVRFLIGMQKSYL